MLATATPSQELAGLFFPGPTPGSTMPVPQEALLPQGVRRLMHQEETDGVVDPDASAHRLSCSSGNALILKPPVKRGVAREVPERSFRPEKHYYPRVLNAQLHPLVAAFMRLDREHIHARYCRMHPTVNREALTSLLAYRPKFFHWAGSDLFNVTTPQGGRCMITIETNSCPSGQKSMPWPQDHLHCEGYKRVIEATFKRIVERSCRQEDGRLAVVYDKNEMEASGYAAVLADVFHESVLLVEYYETDPDPPVRWQDGQMYVRPTAADVAAGASGAVSWVPVRAAFRYVTQKPWKRFPTRTRTIVLNSIVSCLAGGRNKAMAARSYADFNDANQANGLVIRTPDTMWGIRKEDVPERVRALGGHAVIKVPYANAGQGIYTITHEDELELFMRTEHKYDTFIIQSLVGNANWTSCSSQGQFYHIGTLPNTFGETYVADLRMMVASTPERGFAPVAAYARKAKRPLVDNLSECDRPDDPVSTWDMLGTNLSYRDESGNWATATERLILMDNKDFNTLGLGIDDLIDAYVQTVMSVVAIDKMAIRLTRSEELAWEDHGDFDLALFRTLNPDESLIEEIRQGSPPNGTRTPPTC